MVDIGRYGHKVEGNMRAFSVLIADDHELARIGVATVLASSGLYETCGEAFDGRITVEMFLRLKPDLVVLDVGLPTLNGIDAARRILSSNPRQCILVFTEVDSEYAMRKALETGVRGYVLKSDPVSDLLTAAHELVHGRTFFTSRMTEILLALATTELHEQTLSNREREIMQLLVEGNSTTQIAKLLSLSPKTVDTHRSNLRRKLQIKSTADLVVYAVRNEIVRIPELRFAVQSSPENWDLSNQHFVLP